MRGFFDRLSVLVPSPYAYQNAFPLLRAGVGEARLGAQLKAAGDEDEIIGPAAVRSHLGLRISFSENQWLGRSHDGSEYPFNLTIWLAEAV